MVETLRGLRQEADASLIKGLQYGDSPVAVSREIAATRPAGSHEQRTAEDFATVIAKRWK